MKTDEEKWVEERHRCENCGKIMEKKFASGRFCCRSCANTRKLSEEKNRQRREKLLSNPNIIAFIKKYSNGSNIEKAITGKRKRHKELLLEYSKNPNKCCICNKELPYEKRNNKTCGKECWIKLNIEINKNRHFYNSRRGHYDGVYFESTYELAFYIYCKDFGISCEKNKKVSFPYEYKGKTHRYFPDFYLKDENIYIETKGRKVAKDEIKIKAVKNSGAKIELLTKQKLFFAFAYVKEKYDLIFNSSGNNFYLLYDEYNNKTVE